MVLVLVHPGLHLALSLFLNDAQVILHETVKVVWIVVIIKEVRLESAIESSICARCTTRTWLWRVRFHADTA